MSSKKVRPYESILNQEDPVVTPAESIVSGQQSTPTAATKIEVRLNSAKPRWEDNYKLQSYYINLDLLQRLDRVSKKLGKGAKTLLVNEGLNYILDLYETGKNKPQR